MHSQFMDFLYWIPFFFRFFILMIKHKDTAIKLLWKELRLSLTHPKKKKFFFFPIALMAIYWWHLLFSYTWNWIFIFCVFWKIIFNNKNNNNNMFLAWKKEIDNETSCKGQSMRLEKKNMRNNRRRIGSSLVNGKSIPSYYSCGGFR